MKILRGTFRVLRTDGRDELHNQRLSDEMAYKMALVLREEQATEPLRWVYLSFADDARGGFQGAVVIEAHGVIDAVTLCNVRGINPGGEVLCIDIDPEDLPLSEFRNRLLSREDMEKAFGDCKTLGEFEAEGEAL